MTCNQTDPLGNPLNQSSSQPLSQSTSLPLENLKDLWDCFEGSPFAFWDLIYDKSKDTANSVSCVLDPLLSQSSDESFVRRILDAANHSSP